MKNFRIISLGWPALLGVTAVTVCALLLTLSTDKAVSAEMNAPSPPRYLTTIDRPRPEFRIERLLGIDDPNDFDPDLKALLKRKRERQRGMANQAATGYEQIASVSQDQRGARDQ